MASRRLVSLRREPHATRRMVVAQVLALGSLISAFTVVPAQSQLLGIRAAIVARSLRSVVANAVQEASRRFHIPAQWLRAVMRAESGGDARQISEKGAIGLMQVMPQTYAELRAKHGFGPDPFDPRDNILAGAAYLADMFGRYRAPGFLAAYNAGPGRWEEHLTRGLPLPAETTDYVARLAPDLGMRSVPTAQIHAGSAALRAPIFVTVPTLKTASETASDGTAKASGRATMAIAHAFFPVSQDNKVFARGAHSDDASKASSGTVPAQTSGLFVARDAPESTP